MTTTDLGSGEPLQRSVPDAQAFVDMQASPQFQELRHRLRRFVFPMTAFFLTWYAVYVLLATYASDFMATEVFGHVNLGILLGLGQFVTTFAITALYVKFANRELDPRSTAIREELEGRAR
ncbi:DUF485 domain-containing protein [Rhodococcus sp. SGAir0479]|uniref:DUF485 domain-containing protein n=1 Tax=Rhodococcus sp. SGAir0479 TaxID=2567884 RepID=UPI0010CD1F40|nr:DUF485 domain-containing protein [Rhodococcus sp. SGAir0479]QCQ89968.1 DUF485 domain-containing protein [Rhodococcus sp. SGAir0479]